MKSQVISIVCGLAFLMSIIPVCAEPITEATLDRMYNKTFQDCKALARGNNEKQKGCETGITLYKAELKGILDKATKY